MGLRGVNGPKVVPKWNKMNTHFAQNGGPNFTLQSWNLAFSISCFLHAFHVLCTFLLPWPTIWRICFSNMFHIEGHTFVYAKSLSSCVVVNYGK